MKLFIKRAFDFFVFSSLFIGIVSVMMVNETMYLLNLSHDRPVLLAFVFFATTLSYNLHWYFTPVTHPNQKRTNWCHRNRRFQLFMMVISVVGAAWFCMELAAHWRWISISVVLTFLYTAPKLPLPFAPFLQKIAIGKTIFLAFVWAYVTAMMPVLISKQSLSITDVSFFLYRLFFIYSICILFDYRDRESDRQEGIRSMITYFSEKGIRRLFIASVLAALVSLASMFLAGLSLTIAGILLIPLLITASLYRYALGTDSDYFYYFTLDGLMMASALIIPFLPI